MHPALTAGCFLIYPPKKNRPENHITFGTALYLDDGMITPTRLLLMASVRGRSKRGLL
jgi:hypothetical protein